MTDDLEPLLAALEDYARALAREEIYRDRRRDGWGGPSNEAREARGRLAAAVAEAVRAVTKRDEGPGGRSPPA